MKACPQVMTLEEFSNRIAVPAHEPWANRIDAEMLARLKNQAEYLDSMKPQFTVR